MKLKIAHSKIKLNKSAYGAHGKFCQLHIRVHEEEMISRYPYIDRNPCIIAAGKSFGDPCAKAKDCFNDVGADEKIRVLIQQQGPVDAKYYGPERKGPEYSGVFTEIGNCLRGPIKSQFQCIDDEIKNTVYNSYWQRPLGATRDQTPGLPAGMDIYGTTFGKSTKSSHGAAECVNPKKTPGQVLYEGKICHDLYRFSHQDCYPGERIERSYQPPYNVYNVYGTPSKADHSGSRTKEIMTWFNSDPISNVSRRQAAVRERTSAPIGQTLHKTVISGMFDDDHRFGKPTNRDLYGVEDLLNEFAPSALRRDMREFISYANKLRQKVHKIINNTGLMLEEIYDEFLKLDQDKTCSLHFDCINQICKKYFIHLDRSKLEPLLILLEILKPDGIIQYKDFLDFLDLNKDFPPLMRKHYIMPPEYQCYDKEVKLPNKQCTCKNYMNDAAGLPSNPSRKSGPHYALSRVNIDHLGTETTARAVISPSIYTQYGLNHRDFFKPRTKEFLSDLFRRIGCTLSDANVDEIYNEGFEMDKTGGVCVETFKNLLDVRAYKTYQRLQ